MNFRNQGRASALTMGSNLGLRWEVTFQGTPPNQCVSQSVDTTAGENPPVPNGNSSTQFPKPQC